MDIFSSLNIKIRDNIGETKSQQLVNELQKLISVRFSKGDILPSVNTLSKNLNISRDTVVKAYNELKNRGLVTSKPNKGYFVNSNIKKVLLLFDFYSQYKDIVYREINDALDLSYSIDIVFHHYNKNLFESVINDGIDKYSFFVVMNCDIKTFCIASVLKRIDASKLLLLDIPIFEWLDFDFDRYNYICQNFDEAVYAALMEVCDRIKKYTQITLVNPEHLQHPEITQNAFQRFCSDWRIKGCIIKNVKELNVQQNEAFFILRQRDLQNVLKQCKEKNLEVGQNAGIVVYNDNPLYEFVSCGITVISTNFNEMGRKAAQFITQASNFKEVIPTKIIFRKSL